MAGDGSRERLRARLRDGERLLGTFVKSRDPLISETLATAGYDFVVADLEHSSLSAGEVEGIVRACDAHDVPVIARIPATWLALCGALLDAGVTGIQVSDVSSPGVAAAVRAAAHYPRSGSEACRCRLGPRCSVPCPRRSTSGRAWRGPCSSGRSSRPLGWPRCREILESGVFDALFFGPTDLAVSLGHPGDPGHPDVAAALATATDLILGHGTPLGIFCATADEARRWAARGLTLLAISTDLGMLRGAAVSALGQLRAPG